MDWILLLLLYCLYSTWIRNVHPPPLYPNHSKVSSKILQVQAQFYSHWKYAPPGIIQAFVQAFARLKEYRIIRQLNSKYSKSINLSSNVLIPDWIPQTAILNHPKTKLFISHVGLKSMRETICAKVPIVAMPIFADQYRNTAISQYRGFGAFLDKTNLTRETIYNTIKAVLDNPNYVKAVRKLQDQLSDRIRSPSELFKFNIEFQMRRVKSGNDIKKYFKVKWSVLNFLTQWGQADIAIPIVICIFLLFSVVC